MSFTVAIVGRPNVGKSTLFNRLVGRRLALVDNQPGVTRDRREGEAQLGHLRFRVIDTAGLEEAHGDTLEARMRRQTEAAIDQADVAMFLIDARAGVTPLDAHLADLLRRSQTPVILVANKAEGRAGEAGLYDSFRLGLGDPIPLSAEHGEGLGDLHEALLPFAAAAEEKDTQEAAAEAEARPLRLAIVGRPNVGKSTLVNRLIGAERMLTGPEAGITRDAIAVPWAWNGQPVLLFDTAGLRRRARVTGKVEKLSAADTLRAIRFAEVVVLLVDAGAPLEKQDIQIADLVAQEGRALVLAVNKWDLVPAETRTAFRADLAARLEEALPQLRGLPLVTLSAATGAGIDRLMPTVIGIYERWNRRVATGPLNRWLEEMVAQHPPPAPKGRRLRLRYITQIKARPPTFVLFTSRPAELPASYQRYLVNGLRESFGLAGVPLRLSVRKTRNPYAEAERG